MRVLLLTLGLLAWLVACNNQATPEPSAEAPATQAPPAPPPNATPDPPSEPTPAEIPVAEDFEQEVEATVTADNYMAELDAIEQELDAH